MTDRKPGAPGQYKAVITADQIAAMNSGEEFTVTLTRDDRPIAEGTPYNKAAVLPDDLAQALGLVGDPTPADALWALHERIYPVGSIYLSVNDTDPGELFGGTWLQLKDRFLLAAGNTYAAGKTGGEAAVRLKEKEMPAHTHTEHAKVYGYPGWEGTLQTDTYGFAFDYTKTTGAAHYYGPGSTIRNVATVSLYSNTGTSGKGEAHNNMPPYLAVYMWKRIA